MTDELWTRESGALLLDNLEIPNIDAIMTSDAETTALHAEFKLAINSYLKQLVKSPVRSLADLIQFNKRFAKEVRNSSDDPWSGFIGGF